MFAQLKVFSLCGIYMFIGPTLILLNKYILHELNFPYPLFVSGLGLLMSAFMAQIIVRLGFVEIQKKEHIDGWFWYKRVLPVGLAHAATLAFGNTVYLLLNVGFIQMLKSFTPVIILLTGYFAKIENPSNPVMISIFIICLGTAATCSFTPQLNLLGIFVMFMAELTEAIRLVLTQFLLQNLKFGIIEGQYILAPASTFWLFTASAFLELPTMLENDAFSVMINNPWPFLTASLMGFGINFLSYYVIQATSSLTMKVLGTLRNILTIICGVVIYNETITVNETIGYAIALLGFVGYNAAKMKYFDYPSNNYLINLCCHGVVKPGPSVFTDIKGEILLSSTNKDVV